MLYGLNLSRGQYFRFVINNNKIVLEVIPLVLTKPLRKKQYIIYDQSMDYLENEYQIEHQEQSLHY
jgi:hypothetical protein